jgi:hypothetical protein
VAVAALILVAGTGARAQGGSERIPSYDVRIDILSTGDLVIMERIDYDFGTSQRHGIFRDIPIRFRYDDRYDRIYPMRVISVEGSPGTPDRYAVEDVGDTSRLRIGDPDRTISGRHVYTITYLLQGALNAFPGHDELYWNLIGPDWEVPIERATAQISAPALAGKVACFSGPAGSTLSCDSSSVSAEVARFSQRDLRPYDGFTAVVALPKGIVPEPVPVLRERWNLLRAFSVNRVTVPLMLVVLVVVTAWFIRLAWRVGRDRRAVGGPVEIAFASEVGASEQAVPLLERGVYAVEYAPPDGLRPGQVGTLVDEQANVLDVTATIVDLAVRGYLRIEEIPKRWLFGKADWRLVQLKEGEDLDEYERVLLNGLFRGAARGSPPDGSVGDGPLAEVELSDLKNDFVSRLKLVQGLLYDDAARRGWFGERPDKVRARWTRIGVTASVGAALIVAALAWRTHLALVPVPLLVGALFLALFASRMPRRTPRGTGLVRRVRGFRRYIETAEAEPSRFAERANLFYEFLPYAIVFGLTPKWARAFEGLAEVPSPSWYVGTHPFTVSSFSDSVQGFTVTSAGTIASTPSSSGGSGFGGSGGSGGGGGGGGGGSW